MITFKITTYKVNSPEKQALIETYCDKITRRTGRVAHKLDSFKKNDSQATRSIPDLWKAPALRFMSGNTKR
jgi:hypothetical protein